MKYPIHAILVLVLASSRGLCAPTGADFLKPGIGGRASGMGEAFTAVSGGAESSCWNPAGILGVVRGQLSYMHNNPQPDSTLGFVGYDRPLGEKAAWSVSSIFFLIAPIPVTDSTGVIGEATWTDLQVSGSYAREILPGLVCGGSFKHVQRSESDPLSGTTAGAAYALDLGVLYHTAVKGLNLGAALLHNGTQLRMSGEVKIDDLPRTARAGISYAWQKDPAHRLLLSCDASRVLNGTWRGSAGAELAFRDQFFVRTGYFEKDGGVAGITYGFGAVFGKLSLDYSNVPAGQMLGNTRSNKVSLNLTFD